MPKKKNMEENTLAGWADIILSEKFSPCQPNEFTCAIKVTLDKKYDMGKISLRTIADGELSKKIGAKAIQINDSDGNLMFILDMTKDGELVGIEVFNASKRLPKEIIENATIID